MMDKIFNTIALFIPILLAYAFVITVNSESYINHHKEPSKYMFIHDYSYADKCGWECFEHTDKCIKEHKGLPDGFRQTIKPAYYGFIHALRSTGDYYLANLILIALVWPVAMSVLGMRTVQMLRGRSFSRKFVITSLVLSVWVIITHCEVFTHISHFHYLTDFLITLSHATGLSYYDVNALIFVIMWPLITIAIVLTWLFVKKRSYKSPDHGET